MEFTEFFGRKLWYLIRLYNTAQNSSDNIPSYRPDNHYRSHVYCLVKGTEQQHLQ